MAAAGSSLHPAFFVVSWMLCSNLTIIFNKWLLDTAGFRYPVILTCWHMIFTTIATQILARTTSLLDGRKSAGITRRTLVRAILPIGLCYSASLLCSNAVYLYLSVAFIQMLKAGGPIAVLAVSVAYGFPWPPLWKFLSIVVITIGVLIASLGEVQFSWTGFFFQFGGIVFEAVRTVLIQLLLSGDGQKMNPLVGLYYYAPICAVTNLIAVFFTEASSFQWADVAKTGVLTLTLNAGVAFMLNVCSVFLIGKTSALALFLSGTLKNILLIVASVLLWGTPISFLQVFGYAIAVAALTYYSLGWAQLVALLKPVRKTLLDTRGTPAVDSEKGLAKD